MEINFLKTITHNTHNYYLLDDSQSVRNVSETVPNFEVKKHRIFYDSLYVFFDKLY